MFVRDNPEIERAERYGTGREHHGNVYCERCDRDIDPFAPFYEVEGIVYCEDCMNDFKRYNGDDPSDEAWEDNCDDDD